MFKRATREVLPGNGLPARHVEVLRFGYRMCKLIRTKAQFMASEYKKRGGGYTTDKKDQDESQKNLSKWSEEEWQTKEGSGNAKQNDGTRKRYLPKEAWEEMNEDEKRETDEKKLEESKGGKQFVGNTSRAKRARQNANMKESEEYEEKKTDERKQTDSKPDNETDRDDEHQGGEEEPKTGHKRSRGKTTGTSKKQKASDGKAKSSTTGSKKNSANPPAKQASADRLPEKGQSVTWKALPGWVEGTVVEIARENKEVEGKSVKAGKDDPRIVLRSTSSGKIAVHKPEAVYFD